MAEKTTEELLQASFDVKYVVAAVSHYQKAVEKFQLADWETCIAKGGKFAEAILKALWAHAGETVPPGKGFKAGAVIDGLAKKPGTHDDSVRLTMPRACRLIYEVASNRGGRHDAGEIDPNQMDATLAVNTSSWVLAEMLRYSQKGLLNIKLVSERIVGLNQRKLPFIEDIDGRIYFSLKGLSARDVALLTLWKIHPGRINRKELIAAVQRHSNSKANAEKGVLRIKGLVDDDGSANLRLLVSAIGQAEELIAQKEKN
jgi:hypothetical protein